MYVSLPIRDCCVAFPISRVIGTARTKFGIDRTTALATHVHGVYYYREFEKYALCFCVWLYM